MAIWWVATPADALDMGDLSLGSVLQGIGTREAILDAEPGRPAADGTAGHERSLRGPSVPGTTTARHEGGPCIGAEGEGFEPSESLESPHSLSRRAPSATRSTLRAA